MTISVGDKIDMHYRGTLQDTGAEFDASVRDISPITAVLKRYISDSSSLQYNRGTPLSFALGTGQVIKGWDEGLTGMCIGDKRTLTIQPEYGYGARGVGPIPANAVLIFETELVKINGKGKAEEANAEL